MSIVIVSCFFPMYLDIKPYYLRNQYMYHCETYLNRVMLSMSVNVLGEGAFGRVMKADAIGIKASEPSTTVAVKMVKG